MCKPWRGAGKKAREGRWNGGFAPYGYALVDGELVIAEEEAEAVRVIFDKYINTTMGAAKIADWLNQHGYRKIKRQNNTLDSFYGSIYSRGSRQSRVLRKDRLWPPEEREKAGQPE